MENFHGFSFCFDLDGTLIDTAPDLVRVLNETVATDGVPPANYMRARNQVGFGSMALIRLAYKDAERKLDDTKAADLQAYFLKRYAESIDQLSRPFPGVVKTLAALRYHGAELSICTNKPGWLARPLIEKLGLTDLFVRIIGSEDVPKKKPDPQHVFMAAGHQDRARIIMIGDSRPDLGAAQNAGVTSVMVDYGYSPEPVRGMGGDITLSHFRDLPGALYRQRQKYSS
jgi:phosphoglycolate phosphatase